MKPAINATLTRCRNSLPLVVLNSAPFNGLEIRPNELRQMAQELSALADMAARLPMGGKHWRPTHVQLGAAGRVDPEALQREFDARLHSVFAGMFGDLGASHG